MHDRLRERIFSGRFQNGERLVEHLLADELQVSRGPVRDALRLLEAEGLVVSTPRRGTRVASLTAADAAELLAIRAALEPVAVRCLLERAGHEEFDALEGQLGRLAAAATENDWNAVVLEDLAFHEMIFRLSGQRRLLAIWNGLHVPLLQTFRAHRFLYGSIEEVAARHRALLDALRGGDVERAVAHDREHIVERRAELLGLLERTGTKLESS